MLTDLVIIFLKRQLITNDNSTATTPTYTSDWRSGNIGYDSVRKNAYAIPNFSPMLRIADKQIPVCDTLELQTKTLVSI